MFCLHNRTRTDALLLYVNMVVMNSISMAWMNLFLRKTQYSMCLNIASGSFSSKLLKIKSTDPASVVRLCKLLGTWNIRILDASRAGVFSSNPHVLMISHHSVWQRKEMYHPEQLMTQLTAHYLNICWEQWRQKIHYFWGNCTTCVDQSDEETVSKKQRLRWMIMRTHSFHFHILLHRSWCFKRSKINTFLTKFRDTVGLKTSFY